MTRFVPYSLAFLLFLFLSSGCRVSEPDTPPSPRQNRVMAGLRASPYGARELFDTADYWIKSTKAMAQAIPSARPCVIWILGTMEAATPVQSSADSRYSGRCQLNFPGQNPKDANILFSESDGNEAILKRFDEAGISVWLQVEPGNADIEILIDLVLNRYRHHPCVRGFGIDVEWYRWSVAQPEGEAVSDAQAATWLSAVRRHRPDYALFLKHWLTDKMPPHFREGLLFLDDSQMFASQSELRREFSHWGKHFFPAPVGFQYGYGGDRHIWSTLPSPASDMALLLSEIPNAREFYWVDFTARDLWPPGQ